MLIKWCRKWVLLIKLSSRLPFCTVWTTSKSWIGSFKAAINSESVLFKVAVCLQVNTCLDWYFKNLVWLHICPTCAHMPAHEYSQPVEEISRGVTRGAKETESRDTGSSLIENRSDFSFRIFLCKGQYPYICRRGGGFPNKKRQQDEAAEINSFTMITTVTMITTITIIINVEKQNNTRASKKGIFWARKESTSS